MDALGELVVGLIILVGVFGTALPVLPGLALEVSVIFVWAVVEREPLAWAIALLSLALAAVGTLVKFLIPKRRLSRSGIPNRTVLLATACSVVGFFVLPVLGAPIAFVAAVYLSERSRLGAEQAWPATRTTLGAVATSVGIELATALLIAAAWFGTVLLI